MKKKYLFFFSLLVIVISLTGCSPLGRMKKITEYNHLSSDDKRLVTIVFRNARSTGVVGGGGQTLDVDMKIKNNTKKAIRFDSSKVRVTAGGPPMKSAYNKKFVLVPGASKTLTSIFPRLPGQMTVGAGYFYYDQKKYKMAYTYLLFNGHVTSKNLFDVVAQEINGKGKR